MAEFKVQLTEGSLGRAVMHCDGVCLGQSNVPLYAAARKLLSTGTAQPSDTLTTYRGATACMSAVIGEAAELTVSENPWIARTRYRDFNAPRVPRTSMALGCRGVGRPRVTRPLG